MTGPALMLMWNIGLATVLAVVVGMVSRLRMLERRPALVHALWLLVLAKLVTPSFIPVPVLPGRGAEESIEPQPTTLMRRTASSTPLPEELSFVEGGGRPLELEPTDERAWRRGWNIPWHGWLLFVWSGGTLLLVAWGSWQLLYVSRVLRGATSSDEGLTSLGRDAARRMDVRIAPLVSTMDASIAPLLWVRRSGPVIVLPTRLIQQMSDEQIRCILCHELAHYVRRDHWSNAFSLLVAALFWWHPVAWWARREMRAAQEVCCDGIALASGGATRRCYAETLFQALEFVQSNQPLQPALASGFGNQGPLRRRFEMIASQHVSPRFSVLATALAFVSILAMLCFPVRAQLDAGTNGGWEVSSTMQHDYPVKIVACNAEWIATGDEGGNLFVGEAKTGKDPELRAKGGQQGGFNRGVDHLRFAPDGKKLYAVLDQGRSMFQFHLPRNPGAPYDGGVRGEDPSYLGYSPDTLTWLERHIENTALLLRPSPWMPHVRGAKVYESIEYEAEVTQAVMSADNQWVAVVTGDAKLRIHDRSTLREIHTIGLPRQGARDVQFSPDGKRIAVVGDQSLAKVFDTESGKEIAALTGHRGIVFTVAFSPDGTKLVTGGDDSTARVWEAATGKPLAVLQGHTDSVKSVAFAPGGDMLVTGSADKTAKVWRMKP